MTRAPWRDALDGKIKLLRDLQTDVAYIAIKNYLEVGLAHKNVPFSDTQAALTATGYRRELLNTVRQSEPFFLSNDMVHHFERVTTTNLDMGHVIAITDLPVDNGLFWLPGTIEVTDNPNPSRQTVGASLFVKAIGFSKAKLGRYNPRIGLSPQVDGPDIIGVTLFIDGLRSGFENVRSGLLVPFLYQPIVPGVTLRAWAENVVGLYGDTPYDLAHQLWGVLFLWAAFDSMQKRIVRFGGSGLERSLRKQAERAGVSPIVQIMEWRKAAYTYPKNHVPASVDWSCRWSVRPHVRRYKSGKVVNVRGHVKGPEGKEFKQQRERLHTVTR